MKRINWVLLSSFLAVSAYAQPLTLGDLRHSMSKAKSTWTAGQTKVSILDREDQKRLLGAPLPANQDFFFTPASKTVRPFGPASYDWRNVGGTRFSSPVLDQGRCGSCVAFAAIGQLETQMNIARRTPNSPWEFSPQHLFACGGGGCETGWQPMSALSYLQSSGVPDEACFPYQSGAIGEDMACKSTCSDSKSRSQKIVRYNTTSFFFFASIDSIKQALQKGPLMATMVVYEDFMFYKSGVYKYTSGAQLGGHAVVIEGYNDADQSWIVRNSWGPDWGEQGYFRVAWNDQSGVGNSTWSIEVGGADGDVSLGSLRDRAVLSGKTQAVELSSSFADTQRIKWQLLNKTVSVAEGSVARSSSVTMDTTPLADGLYQMVAIAERASGIVRSQPRDVFVLNGTLTGSLKLDNVRAGERLSGKKVLEFSLNSAPIPFTQLVFRAKNVTTGELIERRSPHVASKINLSFNTGNLANGEWELSLEGMAGTQSVASPSVRITVQN